MHGAESQGCTGELWHRTLKIAFAVPWCLRKSNQRDSQVVLWANVRKEAKLARFRFLYFQSHSLCLSAMFVLAVTVWTVPSRRCGEGSSLPENCKGCRKSIVLLRILYFYVTLMYANTLEATLYISHHCKVFFLNIFTLSDGTGSFKDCGKCYSQGRDYCATGQWPSVTFWQKIIILNDQNVWTQTTLDVQ